LQEYRAPSCDARAEAVNAPRNELTNELRMDHIVFAAPTSIVPTAMGRTTLNHSVYAASDGSVDPIR
jgi:hypothetical protein